MRQGYMKKGLARHLLRRGLESADVEGMLYSWKQPLPRSQYMRDVDSWLLIKK